jgi:hypothetical protein
MAFYSWRFCANERRHVAVCPECDVQINAVILEQLNFPQWRARLAAYVRRVREESGADVRVARRAPPRRRG